MDPEAWEHVQGHRPNHLVSRTVPFPHSGAQWGRWCSDHPLLCNKPPPNVMAGHRHLDKVQRGSLSLLLMSGVSAGRLKGWGDLTAGHQNPLEASSLTPGSGAGYGREQSTYRGPPCVAWAPSCHSSLKVISVLHGSSKGEFPANTTRSCGLFRPRSVPSAAFWPQSCSVRFRHGLYLSLIYLTIPGTPKSWDRKCGTLIGSSRGSS